MATEFQSLRTEFHSPPMYWLGVWTERRWGSIRSQRLTDEIMVLWPTSTLYGRLERFATGGRSREEWSAAMAAMASRACHGGAGRTRPRRYFLRFFFARYSARCSAFDLR